MCDDLFPYGNRVLFAPQWLLHDLTGACVPDAADIRLIFICFHPCQFPFPAHSVLVVTESDVQRMDKTDVFFISGGR